MGDKNDLSHVRRIFVRSPNWVGDMVMATASFARIRAAFPTAHITLAARPMLHPLLAGSGWFDEIIPAPRAKGVSGLFRQVGDLRSRACDLAIILPNSLETGLVPFLARVPLRLGYRQGRRGLMNLGLTAAANRQWWQRRRGPRRIPEPMPVYYRKLLDELGIPGLGSETDDLHPRLHCSDEDRQWVDGHLESLGIARTDKVVCLMGPNDRNYTEYCMDDTVLIQKAELECVPCQRKICPLGHHQCMKDITVDEVVAAGQELLAR